MPAPDGRKPSGTVVGGVHAEGARSVAVSGDARLVQTGDNATARIVELPAEAYRPISEVDAPPGIDNLPIRPANFVGRTTELDKLDTMLASAGQVVVQAVHGLGGIGKTTLVAHWAATRTHGCSPILWLTADTPAEITQGLAGFAAALQPALSTVLEVEQLAERGLQWLATHTGWLLVLDNVEDVTDINPVLARAGTGGRIVVTSRRATGWPTGTAVIRLDVLDPTESLELLTGLLTASGPRDEDGAVELCAELGHLPLAIEQAGAYLAQNPFLTPRAYLQTLDTYPAETLGHGGVDTDAERTIAQIWRVTLDRITTIQPMAAELLRVLAWYAPDAIPLSMCQSITDPPTLNTALGVLTAYNMITPDLTTNTVSIHRLVQAVACTPDPTDPHRDPTAIEQARDQAADVLLACLPDHQDPGTWLTWRALLTHVDTFTGKVQSTSVTDAKAQILTRAGQFVLDQGMHTSALIYYRQALTEYERVLGAEHPHTLASRGNLAGAYQSVGRLDEAIPLYEQARTGQERILGPDHPETMAARNNLAYAYQSVGRLDEAIPLYEQVLTDSERILGTEHPDTLKSRSNLAYAYQSVGRLDEAIPLYEQVLTDSERILGTEHPDTLKSRSNLAYAYRSVGRLDEAIPLYEQVLTDSERILGTEHPNTLTFRSNLAFAYESTGRLEAAIPLLEQTLADRERILGDEHPHTLISRGNLAGAYQSAGRLDEAIPLYQQTLTDRERILGVKHPDTLISRNNLAYIYKSAGRLDEAIPLYQQTLTDRERILGDEHPHTLISRNNLAGAYQSAGRLDEAIPLYQQTLTDRERILGVKHPDTLISYNNLAGAYQLLGRLDEAIPLYERTLTISKELLGAEHPTTRLIRGNLAAAREATH
ncbi:tetratricopeptide repeat protein [Nocardia sp. FDAARGOS_372]|uniref:NB-ARC domain-containing protein n=1 Tax=Nocardia farcinica (strain IFM 10152) TaxID=247156 RepID=Q5YM61_NOCFA|nr:tetratricopeptide repeat protein [Nocardia farcinica]MBF6411155.1 tetratricopeptide repeat protein [Nocardia farcinica]PEH74547.1 tetratricopeptide repeat protein [Nocardia sp. FDAARGOS_372]BAD60730.1 hypothetical protein PNF2_450 [Nocardia farcinica IFM 10152]